MNNRERWVVYPLLLWSLALGFRSQYEYLFERDVMECRILHIIDDTGKTRLELIAGTARGGSILFFNPEGAATARLGEKGDLEKIKVEEPSKQEPKKEEPKKEEPKKEEPKKEEPKK